MENSVRKNTFAKIALLVIGVFVTAVVIIIAVSVSKHAPNTVTVANSGNTNTATNTSAPVDPIFSSRIFAATGSVTQKQGNVLTVRGQIYIENVLTEKVFTVEVTPATTYTLVNRDTGLTSESNFGQIQVGDTITFRANDNLVETNSVVATLIDKLIN